MPKISLDLASAKAKDAEILAKLGKVQQAAQCQKQQTKHNQQRAEFGQQARKLSGEARRLEADLDEVARKLDCLREVEQERQAGEECTGDLWFQVAGARALLLQVKHRGADRLRKAPEQALSLQGVLGSVAAAMSAVGGQISASASELEEECASARRGLRQELNADGLDFSSGVAASGQRRSEGVPEDLSDEEDTLLDRAIDGPENYGEELAQLNDQVSDEVAQLDQELGQLRRRLASWDDQSHFRFMCIKRQLHGRGRELLADRLCLEFPHLTREQLQAHEADCDAVKYASQRQGAALRKWRRDRAALLVRARSRYEDWRRGEDQAAARRQEALDQRAKQKQLQVELQIERTRAAGEREERHRSEEEDHRRRHAAEAAREDAYSRQARAAKEMSKEFSERKREAKRSDEETQAERLRGEADERARRLERNATRVRLRRQMDDLKRREVAMLRAAVEKEARERAERLERAAEQFRVEAPHDPGRLTREPARLQVSAYVDPLQCVTRGPHAGFDEKQLMTDARYKMAAAMHAAGLYGTKAGHEALARVQPPRPANPTIASSIPGGVFAGYPVG